MNRPRAAVDSGTNSTRLLLVDGAGRELSRRTTITRLGEGVDATGHLDDAALRRTLDAIGTYRTAWTDAGVDPGDVRIAATSAVRDARDRDRYFDAVRELTGVEAEVLSGDEEARLSFAGAVDAVDVPLPATVVDVGGGSTELIVGDRGGVVAAHSMQLGAVRVTERHLADDPPTDVQLADARAMVDAALDGAIAALVGDGADLDAIATLVGVAGTVTTLAAADAGLASPDDPRLHGRRMPREDVDAWTARLSSMTTAQRAAVDGVPRQRADVIAAGALVLSAVMARLGSDGVVVSRADILDGLVESLA